jgi:pimeloyl-ACP methyl ester carboxylesterase
LSAFYNAAVTPLVFLHGVGGGHSAWDAQVSHFGRLGYACLARDQPEALREGWGHLGPMDQPEASNAVLQRFLR